MNLLYPSFLWALGVLAVPIIIHLFNFRRATRIYFSNTRFLRQVKEASTARRRLKHYLILAARLLFLLFLVITFCQPIIPAKDQLANSRAIVVYLDNSQSMSARLEDKTRGLDAAAQMARSIVSMFPPDTRYKLITNDFAPFSNTFKTGAEIQDLLTQLRLSPVTRSMQEVTERITQDATSGQSQEVFWIADFQKSTAGKLDHTLDSTARWHLVPIRFQPMSNIFVDSAYLENPFAASGEKNVLQVNVRNDGAREADQVNVKLLVNNVQTGAATVSIPAGGMTGINFDLATGLSGLHNAVISFNDFPVTFDNTFNLALNFADKIRVVEVKSITASEAVQKVYGNQQVFAYKGFAVGNFNYNELEQADLVVMNGLNNIEPSLAGAVRSHLQNGGTVLIAPGAQPQVEGWKNALALPALKTVPQEAMVELDRPDFSNPFFENVFEEKSVSLAMPKASRVWEWGSDRSAILRFKNDQPFLSTFDQGGKLYMLASSLDQDHTDFHQHALFVPVMYRLAASSKKQEGKLYYSLNETFIPLRLDSLPRDVPVRLVGKEEVIPGQRVVGDNVFLDIPGFSVEQGFYKIVAQEDTVGLIAFNVNKAESLMEQYTGEEVKALATGGENVSIFEASSIDAFSNEIKERYLGTPLWKYALMAALLFLLAEILLIRFLK
jgi:hypothetical protein